MFKKVGDEAILAEHGRGIARLCDDVKVLGQRLQVLERRISTLENNLAELTKFFSKFELASPGFEAGSQRRGR
ncbi:MAG: hypothetical protein ACP5PX_07360 [Candidatus Hadarchaeum sp.]|uniref:hypothetical protein n=1 Tax=Candidatus Hadarchaeum sp. TaxID=2883567 RepID=UPI003D0FD9E8